MGIANRFSWSITNWRHLANCISWIQPNFFRKYHACQKCSNIHLTLKFMQNVIGLCLWVIVLTRKQRKNSATMLKTVRTAVIFALCNDDNKCGRDYQHVCMCVCWLVGHLVIWMQWHPVHRTPSFTTLCLMDRFDKVVAGAGSCAF